MPDLAFPRGSEWRKWDLHVHTPFSALNNGFGQSFDEYATRLFQKAIDGNIAAIGVTDYFSVEGYRRLSAWVTEGGPAEEFLGADQAESARKILLLPNVELRSSVIVTGKDGQASRVNYHVILSDQISPDDIDNYFLRELRFTAESNPDFRDERWSVTDQNLAALGARLKAEHEHFRAKPDLFVGMMNAVVSHEDVTEVFERQSSRFRNRYLFVACADEDLSKLGWNG